MPEKEKETPNEWKVKLAKDEHRALINELLTYTEQFGDPALYNQVLVQSSRLEAVQKAQIQGILDYDDWLRTKNTITLALLDIINGLPDEASETKQDLSNWGISELGLKRTIFRLLVGGKLAIAFYVFFLWQTGSGFTFDGVISVLAVLVPTLASYIGIVYQDLLKNRRLIKKKDFRVDRSIRQTAYFFFLIYYAAILLVLYLHGIGVIPDAGLINNEGKPDYKALIGTLALIETFLGGYISILIHSLFRKE